MGVLLQVGLVQGHAYSVLRVKKAGDLQFVQVSYYVVCAERGLGTVTARCGPEAIEPFARHPQSVPYCASFSSVWCSSNVLSEPPPTRMVLLLQLRNPWGRFEWKGKWGDEDPLWQRHPEVKAKLRFKKTDDGLFWYADVPYSRRGAHCAFNRWAQGASEAVDSDETCLVLI